MSMNFDKMNIYYLLANKRSNSRQVDPRQKVGFEQWGRASIWKRRDTRTKRSNEGRCGSVEQEEEEEEEEEEKKKNRQ